MPSSSSSLSTILLSRTFYFQGDRYKDKFKRFITSILYIVKKITIYISEWRSIHRWHKTQSENDINDERCCAFVLIELCVHTTLYIHLSLFLYIYENLISKATLRDAILISNNLSLSHSLWFILFLYVRAHTHSDYPIQQQHQRQHKRKIIDPWCYALMHRRVFHSNAIV